MRTNLPVLDSEYPFPRGETLVSTTDLKGRILHCNPTFITVSGFTREELLGQPHNLIRHPDMPEEAFRDLWATIASGRPWSGLVKNRRKDARYYWVLANVTPLMDGAQPVGYLSVRTEASREQIAAAEKLYAVMRREKADGRLVHVLDGGTLCRATFGARAARLLQPSMGARIALTSAALSGTAALGAAAVAGASAGLVALCALAAAAIGGALGGFVIGRSAVAPIEGLIAVVNRMAAGDLTQAITTQGSGAQSHMRRALAQLNVNLRSIVRDARNEVQRMHQATGEIAEGNHDLSARTESQAANLEQTAASMEEITGTVRNSSQSALQAAEQAGRACDVTARGSQAMRELAQTMHSIDDSSRRIGEIIGVIDSIAFQTNILALNAAVEAARAGEQGRGFAVVAGEVRALAQRTTGAAREIKQIIDASAGQVRTGTQLASQAQRTMDDDMQAVRDASQSIEGISAGSQQQLAGISQVNEAVAQMDTITQQNAALVEQIAASATGLQAQATTLTASVQVFRLDMAETLQAGAADAVALRKRMRAERGNTPRKSAPAAAKQEEEALA